LHESSTDLGQQVARVSDTVFDPVTKLATVAPAEVYPEGQIPGEK
jgi:hypothetical protein